MADGEICCNKKPIKETETLKCCNDTDTYDPKTENKSTYALDISKLANIRDSLKTAVSGVGEQGADLVVQPGATSVSISKISKELCCTSGKQTEEYYDGTLAISLGGFGGKIPLAGIPYAIEGGIEFNLGLSGEGNIKTEAKCDNDEHCAAISIKANSAIGGYGAAVGRAIVLGATGKFNASTKATVCTNKGPEWSKMCGSISATLTLAVLDGAIEKELWDWQSKEICSN